MSKQKVGLQKKLKEAVKVRQIKVEMAGKK